MNAFNLDRTNNVYIFGTYANDKAANGQAVFNKTTVKICELISNSCVSVAKIEFRCLMPLNDYPNICIYCSEVRHASVSIRMR